MLKRLITGTVALIIIGASSTVGYTDDLNKSNELDANIEVIKEEKELNVVFPENNFTTSEDTVLLSGRGKEGTNITIEVYKISEKSTDSEDFEVTIEEKLIGEYTVEIGELEVFNKEIKLEVGKNKILVYPEDNDENSIIKHVMVADEEKAKDYLNELKENNLDKDNLMKSIKKSIED
ncbi:hypothetical protein [Clostridiisalibacter paucivorans]|uniref:hypothetical protein n=1 Tax=Clostridiisalibacter paucivorans TaxID=408753 RepID=UPI000479ECA5|nr:hypothetical protein [Clostridiisalibacter paucivorans]